MLVFLAMGVAYGIGAGTLGRHPLAGLAAAFTGVGAVFGVDGINGVTKTFASPSGLISFCCS